MNDAPKIDFEAPAPIAKRHISDAAAYAHPGVIDHQRHWPSEQRFGLVGERGHLLFTTYVAAVGDSPTFAQFREYAGGLLGALAVYIRADH